MNTRSAQQRRFSKETVYETETLTSIMTQERGVRPSAFECNWKL